MSAFEILPNSPVVFSENFTIRSYHTDLNRRLTIYKLCSFFQDIAGNHTIECGVGWETMQEQNVFWVLSRMKIHIVEFPEWRQKVKVSTWSNGSDGLFAYRNFLVEDESGKVFVKASSMWLMVNIETRRIVRPDDFMRDFPLCAEKLFDVDPEKIPSLTDKQIFIPSIVTFTETDMNFHVNNVSYIERIINSFDFEYIANHSVVDFEINFIKEALPGDNLSVSREQVADNEFLCSINRESDEVEMVRTRIKWN